MTTTSVASRDFGRCRDEYQKQRDGDDNICVDLHQVYKEKSELLRHENTWGIVSGLPRKKIEI